MNIAIGSDHAGVEIKFFINQTFRAHEWDFKDFGTHTTESVDYPTIARELAAYIDSRPYHLGFLICGSGNGMSMVANKYPHIRSAVCWNPEIAKLAREHNHANICAIPARSLHPREAIEIVYAFLSGVPEGGRHADRVKSIRIPG
jgi:ribose 5-phosphate isomerase B